MVIGLVCMDALDRRSRGGIGTFTANLSAALAARGHEIHVFLPAGRREVRRAKGGIHLHRLPPGGCAGHRRWPRALAGYLAGAGRRLALDVLEGSEFGASLHGAIEARNAGLALRSARLVVALHGSSGEIRRWDDPRGGADRRETFCIRAADGLIAPSRLMLKRAERLCGGLLPPSALIRPPLGERPDGAGSAGGRDPGRLLYVGLLKRGKGADLLFESVLPWMRRVPGLRLRLAGREAPASDGPSLREALLRRIPPSLRARFEFAGPLGARRLRRELETCGALVLPSRFESFGYAGLEALTAGAPLIATRSSGVSELLEHGRSGLLCRADAAGLRGAIGRFLSMPPAARAALGRRAARAARAACDPGRAAQRRLRFYRSLAARADRPAARPQDDDMSRRAAAASLWISCAS